MLPKPGEVRYNRNSLETSTRKFQVEIDYILSRYSLYNLLGGNPLTVPCFGVHMRATQ